MEHSIVVGLLVGVVIGTSTYIWNSASFNKTQKIILVLLLVFPPAQWVGILLVLANNYWSVESSSEKVNERKVEQVKNNLELSLSNLFQLKEKGLLTDLEYYEKVAKINTVKVQQDIQNLPEYKQLKSLFDSGILTKDEFESKIKILKIDKNPIEIKPTQDYSKIIIKDFYELIYFIRYCFGRIIILVSILTIIFNLLNDSNSWNLTLSNVLLLILGIFLTPNLYSFLVKKIWK